jgi:HAD superfamily hydrolase (TIGR01509 family)
VSAEASVHLSRAHMALLARATVLPAGHRELVERLRTRHRLALVSNFDDTGTAYAVLVRHDLARHLDAVVVSEALGLRKPHPAPVRAALGALEVDAAEALFVGDTLAEDVAAAHAAGVDAVWIDAAGAGVPPGAPAPRWVVRALPEIAALPGLHR